MAVLKVVTRGGLRGSVSLAAMKSRKKNESDYEYQLRAQETAKAFKALEAAGGIAPSIGKRIQKRRNQLNKRRIKMSSAELQRSRILKDLKSDLPKVDTKFW